MSLSGQDSPPFPAVSVVIPAHNNRSLLARFLPPLKEALAAYPQDTQLVVVDNGSKDGTAEWLRQAHPETTVVEEAEALGFARACNLGARATHHPLVLFLNSDVEVERDFLAPLSQALGEEKVFAASAYVFDVGGEGPRPESIAEVSFERGVFHIEPRYDESLSDPCDLIRVVYAPAAALLVRKAQFEALGGFDPLFSPFSWEDVDLCYRARRRGWEVVVVWASRVWHHRSATVQAMFELSQQQAITHRNQLLMVWKNVRDLSLLAQHLVHLPLHLGAAALRGRWWYFRSLGGALRLLPAAWRVRRALPAGGLSDREILRRVGRPQAADP